MAAGITVLPATAPGDDPGDGSGAGSGAGPAEPPGPPGRRRRRDRAGRGRTRGRRRVPVRSGLVLLLVLALLVTAAALGIRSGRGTAAAVVPRTDRPPVGREEAAAPLGQPEPAPASTAYAFLQHQDGSEAPVAFDPCRPVHWVVRRQGSPSYGQATLEWAFDRLSRATGLRFVADGDTDEAPQEPRSAYQPARYGLRWAPILVAWSWPGETSELEGGAAGMGGPMSVWSDAAQARVAVSGQVILDAPQLAALAAHGADAVIMRAVVLHELAHVLGLGHVTDSSQLMYTTASTGVVDLADGDRAGLARLGRGPCAPDL